MRIARLSLSLALTSALVLTACPAEEVEPPEPGPTDADGDGVPAEEDCDDDDPLVFPGAAESCDGKDTDCDPSTDEAGTIHVPGVGGFTDLGEALAAASGGTTLTLCEGSYAGGLEVPEDVSLEAREGQAVRIVGDGASSVLDVERGSVRLAGLHISGGLGGVTSISGGLGLGGGVTGAMAERLELDGCTFEDNEADLGGHVFAPIDGELLIRDSTFRGGRASLQGGAVHVARGGELTVEGSSFEDNEAEDGGAISVDEATSLALSDASFTGNAATLTGGALLLRSVEAVSLSGADFVENTALEGGGSWLEELGVASLSEVSWQANLATEGYAGGAFFGNVGELTLTDSELTGNSAFRAGGLRIYSDAGGDELGQGDEVATLTRVVIWDNESRDRGGGLHSAHLASLVLEDCDIRRNTAAAAAGGGLFLREIGSTEIGGSLIIDNALEGDGGGIYATGLGTETLRLEGTDLEGNRALDGFGGGVHASQLALFELVDSEIEESLAAVGGGVFLDDTPLEATGTNWGWDDADNSPGDIQVNGGESYTDVGTDISCVAGGPCE